MERIVIIGAGQGGFQAAASLRQLGFDGVITLIGEEPGLPYQRPPLSKAYLKTGAAEALNLRPEGFFAKNNIDLQVEVHVDTVDRDARCVIAGDRRFPYDHLIFATGTRNMTPPIPGLEHTLGLRTLADARRLRAALERSRKIAVIGGGFIGLEFAAVACALGHDVTVAEAAPRLMSRAVSEQMSRRFLEKHDSLGTRIVLGQPVSSVSEGGIVLSDGTSLEADLILLSTGVVPNTELAVDAGLEVANGVVVDATLRTSDPAISALGDCAAFPESRSGRLVRLESVQAATDHARCIANNLVRDEPARYDAVPWFWSDQADWKLQIAGLADLGDEAVQRADGAVLRFAQDRLVAVETINDAKTHMKARRLLGSAELPRRSELAGCDFDLMAA